MLYTNTEQKTIKERLEAYAKLLREIHNQDERLQLMASAMASPSSSQISGTPRAPGTGDRTGRQVAKKIGIEETLERLNRQEAEELAALEALVERLDDPDERSVIRLKYFDLVEWESIAFVLYGDERDFLGYEVRYLRRCYRLHRDALEHLRELDEMARAEILGEIRA